jgi:hypothetical protein
VRFAEVELAVDTANETGWGSWHQVVAPGAPLPPTACRGYTPLDMSAGEPARSSGRPQRDRPAWSPVVGGCWTVAWQLDAEMTRSPRLTLAELTARVPLESLVAALALVPDPRHVRARLDVTALLTLTVCAMLCGARSFYAVEPWARAYGPALTRALGFHRPIVPSQGTLLTLFARLDREQYLAMLAWWVRRQGVSVQDALPVDPRELEGQHGTRLPGIELVVAYLHQLNRRDMPDEDA